MSRSRILTSIAAGTIGILLLGACSVETLGERAASFGLEQAIEGDQDIDFDFGDDGTGGFSISTDEGEFSLNFDEDNGGIVFDTDEGAGAISFDEDGIVFDTDEGAGAISFDEDGIVFDTDEGDGAISFDEDGIVFDTDEGAGAVNFGNDGSFSIDTEDGSLSIFGSTEAPDSWPTQIGVPATLVPGSESFSVLNLGAAGVVTSGVFNHAADEPYAAGVVDQLIDAGWTVTISSNQNGSFFAQLGNDAGHIAQIVGDDAGFTTVSFTQLP